MTRDFNRDLTILVAGSGNATIQNLEDSLGDWMFPDPEAEREVTVIVPVLAGMGGGIRNLIKIGTEWEFNFKVIQAKDAPMTRELSALPEESFIRADGEREALEQGLAMLTERHKAGDETAFILAYNPESTYEQGNPNLSDYEMIGEAKNYQWLQTLNLCESLVDSFEGFLTTDEILKQERLQKEFEDKQREIEAAKPAPTKKVTAPRKRAAKKVEKEIPLDELKVDEKPLQEPSEPIQQFEQDLLDGKIGGPIQDDPRNELSANVPIVIGPSPDIQEDIREAHAQVEKTHTIVVSKVDLAQLSTDIKGLTEAFGNIMDTFTRILKDG